MMTVPPIFSGIFRPTGTADRSRGSFRRADVRLGLVLAATLLTSAATSRAATNSADWPNVGNDKGGTRYSPLDEINRENVSRLKVAWTYHTGDSSPGRTIECTPVVVDGFMYV